MKNDTPSNEDSTLDAGLAYRRDLEQTIIEESEEGERPKGIEPREIKGKDGKKRFTVC